VQRVLSADVLVLSSPTYKGSYSGLLKAFLDRVGGGALAGAAAIPILLGGAPNHTLAVNVHFAPLLVELGAVVTGGLFVLESDVDAFPAFAAGWVAQRRALLEGAVASHRAAVAAVAAAAEGDSAAS
jgi:FMN reductase